MPPPAPRLPDAKEADRFDLPIRRTLVAHRADMLKEQAKWKRARTRKEMVRNPPAPPALTHDRPADLP